MERCNKKNVLTISLLAALGLAGCASNSDSTNGTQATDSSGGASNTNGVMDTGGEHTGGNPGTSGGSTSAGVRIGQDCTGSDIVAAPTDGLIADFADVDGGYDIAGGRILTFPKGSTAAPTYTTTNGSLHIMVDTPATSVAQYVGVALGFGRCIDATLFSGVQFTIRGSFSGCAMQYTAGDIAHQDETSGAPFATGLAGSYQPSTTLNASQFQSPVSMEAPIPVALVTMRMPFGSEVGGNPASPVDKSKLILILWQFNVAPATGTAPSPCTADITIDDVAFYK